MAEHTNEIDPIDRIDRELYKLRFIDSAICFCDVRTTVLDAEGASSGLVYILEDIQKVIGEASHEMLESQES